MTQALNRQALYDLVWSKPMTAVAKEYGLSDRGLAKLCERNSVPVPPRGYADDKISFQIAERIKQYRRELTAKEKEDWLYSKQKWRQEKENTGKFEVTLSRGERNHVKIKILEDDERPLEDMLNEVVSKIIEVLWFAKCGRLEHEERERQRWQEEHERYERKQAAEKERKRKFNLEYKAASWRRAQDIRDYVAAVETGRAVGQLQIDETVFTEWKTWATAHADALDFIAHGNPLINIAEDPEELAEPLREDRGYGSTAVSSGYYPGRKWYQ